MRRALIANRRLAPVTTVWLVVACVFLSAQGTSLATVPDNLPPAVRTQLLSTRAALEARIDAHNRGVREFRAQCEGIQQTDPRMAACGRDFQAMKATESTLETDKRQFASAVVAAVESARTYRNEQLAAISREIRTIQVPPPIPAQDATIKFGQLAPTDERSKRIMHGLEVGVAVAHMVGAIGGAALPPAKIIMATGAAFIAAEDAADVYLVKQNDVYERALEYMRTDAQRAQFTAIVRAIKEQKPISENVSVDMLRAARAITDPSLGNSSTRIAWNAMMSPDARHAAMTAVGIHLAAEIVGQTMGAAFRRIEAAQRPAFQKAQDLLARGTVGMKMELTAAQREAWKVAIDESNAMIARTYHAVEPSSRGAEQLTSIYVKWAEEENRERPRP